MPPIAQPVRPPSMLVQGVLWMIGCLASFIGMAVASRELAGSLSVVQILFFRSLVGLGVLVLLAPRVWPACRKAQRIGLHLTRNIIHFAAQYCWTLGVVLLPLAEVFALEFTMPVWVAVFAWALLGERIHHARLTAVLGSFAGVLVILRPGVEIIDPAAFIVLAAAMGYGLSIVLVKRLTEDCAPLVIVAFMIVMQLPMGFALALLDWRAPTLPDLPWILLAGITGLSAHYTMARALRLLEASTVVPIDFARVPLIALVGFWVYGEALDPWLGVGAFMIFAANYYALRREARAAP
ncbi:DMT family transporter [Dinoroseobacter sp. S76]|uniref:DMT family transporter n=1 Tax=Dinoroseobacter sp. S76 TaxID=3415124 RepID=UPI003C7D5ADD